jgi:tetratricopeptide (TPR) repeat protein
VKKACDILKKQAMEWEKRGRAHYKKGEFYKAEQCFIEAIGLYPYYADPFYNRGLTRERIGEYAIATDDYTEFLELKPRNPDGYFSRARCYYKIGRKRMALADLDYCCTKLRDKGCCERMRKIKRELGQR